MLYEQVLCDIHAHPSSKNEEEELLGMLGSPGLVGLAARVGKENEKILTYEKAVELLQRKGDASFWGLKKANEQAEIFAFAYDLQDLAASDCHRDSSQAKISGIYVDRKVLEEEEGMAEDS